jgi:bacterioferritin
MQPRRAFFIWRKMDESLKNFIDALNFDLALERKAQIQYEQHAALLSGWYFAFANELLTHAEEERGHANKLNDLIVVLGGVPGVEVEPPEVSTMCEEMIKQDLEGELTAINRYKERLCEARGIGLAEAEPTLIDILVDDVDHKNFVLSILGE